MTDDIAQMMMARLVEAFRVTEASTRAGGHRKLRSLWPETFDRNDYPRGMKYRRHCSPQEIADAEEALGWFALIEDADSRRALQYEVFCRAGRGNFSRLCKEYGWTRSTVQSRNLSVLKRLAKLLFPEHVKGNASALYTSAKAA